MNTYNKNIPPGHHMILVKILFATILFGQCLAGDQPKTNQSQQNVISTFQTRATNAISAANSIITNLSNSSSMFSTWYPSPSVLSLSSKPSAATTTTSTVALVLIQSTKHIKLKLVRDQFQQFIDMFSVKLQNITIDFDIIDGKYTTNKKNKIVCLCILNVLYCIVLQTSLTVLLIIIQIS